jgi:cathepsin L
LIAQQPIIVYFWAETSFTSYSSGVYSCSRTAKQGDLNHGVVVFGYDTVGNYLIKNSWGKSWGTNGFATIDATKDCGLTLIVLQYDDGKN